MDDCFDASFVAFAWGLHIDHFDRIVDRVFNRYFNHHNDDDDRRNNHDDRAEFVAYGIVESDGTRHGPNS